MNGFPPDPSDGMIVEIEPGIYYQYAKNSQSWIRLAGYQTSVDLVTPRENGLMSKEDYQKLKGLLIPPPFTSLTSTGCGFVFDSGTFGFRSSNEDVFIDYEVKLRDEISGIDQYEVFHIHENTYGLNFRVNQEKLVEELERRGHLTYKKRIGEQGKQGKRGAPGQDKLYTGPVGIDGLSGKNMPWPGVLSLDTAPSPTDFTQGVVDIFTEEISENENYLVMVKGNIVNSTYCPRFVKPLKINSPWVVVIDDRLDSITKYRACETVDSCGLECSGLMTTLIQYCTSKLYYMDITDITAAIRARFDTMLATLKSEKEKVATDWLNNMIAFFAEQKLALCCAITNVNSWQENRRVREYIESQRIQAAQAEMQLVIGDRESAKQIKMNGADCQYPVVKESTEPPPPLTDTDPMAEEAPADSIVNIDAALHVTRLTAINVPLAPGDYVMIVTQCCPKVPLLHQFGPAEGQEGTAPAYYSSGWTGEVVIEFLDKDGSKMRSNNLPEWYYEQHPETNLAEGGASSLYIPESLAKKEFLGKMLTFSHVGTSVNVWSGIRTEGESIAKPGVADGWVQVTFREAIKVQTPSQDPNYECATVPSLPSDLTGNPQVDVFYCDMSSESVNWYETGWRTGACCGAHLNAGGVDWIVVKRSIADDIICGGGESLNTPCIKEAIENGFHPSVAFPTSNGLEFLGKPTSVQRLFRDLDLESEIMSKIRSGTVYSIKGDPVNNFEGVIFPYDATATT